MYYSQSIEEYNLCIFKLFIERTIEGYKGYIDEIASIVFEAKEYSQTKRSIFDLNKESYPLIIYLSKNGSELLNKIDPYKIQPDEYVELLDIFNAQYSNSMLLC